MDCFHIIKSFIKDLHQVENEQFLIGHFSGCKSCILEKCMLVFKNSMSKVDYVTNFKKSSIFIIDEIASTALNGFPAIVIGIENWKCSYKYKENDEDCKCLEIKTMKVFKNQKVNSKEYLENIQSEIIKNNSYEIVHFIKFPLKSNHCKLCLSSEKIQSNLLSPAVKIKMFALCQNGVNNIEDFQEKIKKFVSNDLLTSLDEQIYPSANNARYFPSASAIREYSNLIPTDKNFSSFDLLDTDHICEKFFKESENLLDKISQSFLRETKKGVGVVALHLGAGYHSSKNFHLYQELCEEALRIAVKYLRQSNTAGKAAVEALKVLENSELTNAGRGSNLTSEGKVECEASIMDTSLNLGDSRPFYGAVSCVSRIKNPITAAYELARKQNSSSTLSLGRIAPCFLSGSGAESWARNQHLQTCDELELISGKSLKVWEHLSSSLNQLEGVSFLAQEDQKEEDVRLDTIGVVVVDRFRRVAAASSTGGLLMKTPGRVGQVSTYGCGCFAEMGHSKDPSVAVVGSGTGEYLIFTNLVRKCGEKLKNTEPYEALNKVFSQDFIKSPILEKVDHKMAGLLTLISTDVDQKRTVEVVWGHTTQTMLIGHMSTLKTSKPQTILSKLPSYSTSESCSISGSWFRSKIRESRRDLCEDEGESSDYSDSDEDQITDDEDQITDDEDQMDIDVKQDLSILGSEATSRSQVDGRCDEDHWKIDPEIKVEFISSEKTQGLDLGSCSVELSEDFHRKIIPKFEKKIENRWQNRKMKNPRLFNGQKFRLHQLIMESQKLKFQLGLTCYRDYQETNMSQDIRWLQEEGLAKFQNPQVFLSEALGVAGIVVTSDKKVIFMKRSMWVGESAGKIDVPGGHPEPAEAVGLKDVRSFVKLKDLNHKSVLQEIFESQLKEVRDEINISMDTLSDMKLIGVVRNQSTGGRAVCYFTIKCSLSEEEVLRSYNRGGVETDESTQLLFLPQEEVCTIEVDSPDLWKRLCPNGRAAVTLFSILQQIKNNKTPFQKLY